MDRRGEGVAVRQNITYEYAVLPIGQKILTLSRILTKCFKWSENGQKIRTKSEIAAEDSEEETNTIMLRLCNTVIDTIIITSTFF